MKIRVDDDGGHTQWVELQGTDAELNAAKEWVYENIGDRARPYKNNRTLGFREIRDHRNPNQILATTIPMFYKADAMWFKLVWG